MMFIKNRLLSLLVLVCLLFSLVPAGLTLAEGPTDTAPELHPIGTVNGKSVLFDNTHGQTAGAADWVIDGAFSDFGDALANSGYYVKELRKETSITLSDLSNYDVFVIPEANIPYKTSEQQAMLDYVEDGGSIFFITDHYNADRNKNRWDASEVFNGYRRGAWNDPAIGMSLAESQSGAMQNVASSDWLSDHFGVRIRYNALGDVLSDFVVSPSQAFNITEDVTQVTMHAGSTLAITDPTKSKGIVYIEQTNQSWSNAVDQGVYSGGGIAEGPYAAVSKVGIGKAAFIGDSSPVEDITPKYKREETGGTKTTYNGFYDHDNHVLLLNIVDWLAVQENYTALDQVAGLTLDQPTALLSMENPQTSTEPHIEPWATPAVGYKWWDSSTFKIGSYGYESTDPIPPDPNPVDPSAESFESGSKGSYTLGNVVLGSGSWAFDNALLGDLATDKKNGAKSARIRANGSIRMNFDVTGAQSVKVQHANFGTDTGANWKLQKSINSGTTWTDVGGPYTSGSSLVEQTIIVNELGSVRFKVVVSGTSGQRINIDDFTIVQQLPTNENFESGSKGAYALGNVLLDSGSWAFDNALLGDLATDKKNGSKSARLRANGSMTMNFDVTGTQSIKVQHANFGTDTGANWKLQKSINSGTTWTDVGGPYTSGSSLVEQTIIVNELGSVRFKVVVSGTSGKRINIDDLQIIH